MKYYVLALALIAASPAIGRDPTVGSKTVRVYDKANPEHFIGSATLTGNTVYFRDAKGELFQTMTLNADGTRTMHDPSGKVLEILPGPDPKQSVDTYIAPQYAR